MMRALSCRKPNPTAIIAFWSRVDTANKSMQGGVTREVFDIERAPLRVLRATKAPPSLHPAYAMVFATSYMMGSGFLTLPRAYVECSILVGSILTAFIALGATASAECLLDVMARAKLKAERGGLPVNAGSFYRVMRRQPGHRVTAAPPPMQRYAQVVDLVYLFMGAWGGMVYILMLVGFMTGSLWCYAAIFATSLEAHGGQPFGTSTYKLFVAAFGCLVVPLACRDLAEQKRLQATLTAGRAVMLLMMTLTAGIALYHDGPLATIENHTPWRASISAAPIIAFSCTLHHSVPQITMPVVPRDDLDFDYFTLNWIFRGSFALSAAVYVVFAAVIATFFGEDTRSSVNLDWADYRMQSSSSRFTRVCSSIVMRYVVLYPAVNVVSSYPLSAVTLGDALLATYRSRPTIDDFATHVPPSRLQIVVFRLIAAVTPLVGAFFASDISSITRYTGIFGLCMCAAFPGVLSLAAMRATPGPTVHRSALNTPGAAVCLIVVGSLLAITPILSAILNAEHEKYSMHPLDFDDSAR